MDGPEVYTANYMSTCIFLAQITITQRRPVYVQCVMHKCIMVKLGGNEKHKKYVKNT